MACSCLAILFRPRFGRYGKQGGKIPAAALVEDSKGNLYGTTYQGGTMQCGDKSGCGVLFLVNQAAGKEIVVHRFMNNSSDGGYPSAPLVHLKGSFYGTTQLGGTNNCGTVFQYTPAGASSSRSKSNRKK